MERSGDMVLLGEYDQFSSFDEVADAPSVDTEDLNISVPYRHAGIKVAEVSVPDGWQLSVPTPIFFRSSGFCTGGRVNVMVGQVSYSLVANAPYCQFSDEDG